MGSKAKAFIDPRCPGVEDLPELTGDLSYMAVQCCVQHYRDYPESEIKYFSDNQKRMWLIGRRLVGE